MGYNFNTPWKIPELENQNFPSFAQTAVGKCSVDLKLGNRGGLEENWVGKFSFRSEKLSVMESSPSGSSKRVKTPATANLVPSCLVDGCISDLSKCRDYHRRHKVCEIHSKTPKVSIRGLEQRFCQQCSRFHSLSEFDEGKRSCRKRLDGHNRRRRKPQPDSHSVNSARLFSYHQGTRYLQFGGPQQLYSSPAWIGAVKTENDPLEYGADQSSLNFSIGRKCEKQFPFLQCSSSDGAGGSNRVLSLLSADSREISLVHAPPPVVPSLDFHSLRMDPEPDENVAVSRGSGDADIGNQGLFQNGSHQTLSFSWE